MHTRKYVTGETDNCKESYLGPFTNVQIQCVDKTRRTNAKRNFEGNCIQLNAQKRRVQMNLEKKLSVRCRRWNENLNHDVYLYHQSNRLLKDIFWRYELIPELIFETFWNLVSWSPGIAVLPVAQYWMKYTVQSFSLKKTWRLYWTGSLSAVHSFWNNNRTNKEKCDLFKTSSLPSINISHAVFLIISRSGFSSIAYSLEKRRFIKPLP